MKKKPAPKHIEPEPEVDSFVAAKSAPELFGKPLHNYSPSRVVAAQSMGMLYPFIGDEGYSQFLATGMYPGALRDTITLLWLCTRPDADEDPDAEWTPSRAGNKPREAYEAAQEWAADKGLLNTGSPRFREAFGVFMSVANQAEGNKFEVLDEGATNEDDGPKV